MQDQDQEMREETVEVQEMLQERVREGQQEDAAPLCQKACCKLGFFTPAYTRSTRFCA